MERSQLDRYRLLLTPRSLLWFSGRVKLFLVALLIVPIVTAAFLYVLFATWGSSLPMPKSMEQVQPNIRSIVLDRNGAMLGGFFVEDRVPVPLSKMPDHLIQSVLSVEDRRFYSHWGLNLAAIARALLSNLRAGGVTQGASTITQQLARNLFLSQNRTLKRKLQELVLAIRLERSFSKDEILTLYLNRIYFGEGSYGVQAASRRYFGKDVSEIDLVEAALLAGLPANPSRFSPVRHPETATNRRNRVLKGMLDMDLIDRPTYEESVAQPLGVSISATSRGEAPYFLEHIRRRMMDRYGTDGVYKGGLQIHTTLDLELQHAAEIALEENLRRIEEEKHYKETYASYLEGKTNSETGARTPYLQGALIALEPQTGRILAFVGGRSWSDSEWDRATQARLQPGSAFKPFIYALALQRGWRTNDIIMDEPVRYLNNPADTTDVWEPKNFKMQFKGPMTLRYALAKSINVPSVKLLEQLGPTSLVEFVQRAGIHREIPPYLSLALGTAEVSLIEMAAAYGTFANQGIFVSPTSVIRVENPFGRILEESRPATSELLDEKTNALLLSILRSVFEWGTAATARAVLGFQAPAAGKTGTTDDYTDAWFIGFVPRCVCAVWVGFDERRSIGNRMTGARAALPIWVEFMKKFVEQNGIEDFTLPSGLVSVGTCEVTGRLPTPDCPVVWDLFIKGTEPKDRCIFHVFGRTEGWPASPGVDRPD